MIQLSIIGYYDDCGDWCDSLVVAYFIDSAEQNNNYRVYQIPEQINGKNVKYGQQFLDCMSTNMDSIFDF